MTTDNAKEQTVAALLAASLPYLWRDSDRNGNQEVAYIDARDVMDRLDEVVGHTGWSTAYRVLDLQSGAVECTLTVLGVAKADVGYPNRKVEPLKDAYSDALKRAAIQHGIGRFLYRIPMRWKNSGEPVHEKDRDDGAPRAASGSARSPAPASPPTGTNATSAPARRDAERIPATGTPTTTFLPATESQVRAIYTLSSKKYDYDGPDTDRVVAERHGGRRPAELSRREASVLIDLLNKSQ